MVFLPIKHNYTACTETAAHLMGWETWALLEKSEGLKYILSMFLHTLSEYTRSDKQNLFC